MADEKFRLPGTSYEELSKIIQAYGELNREVSPGEVATVVGKPATEISRNNAFLVSVGVLQGGNKKGVTELGGNLARALRYSLSDEIARLWRHLVSDHDFIQKVLSAVRIRRGMERSSLVTHIGYSAGQTKTRATMTGASCLIDVLLSAELLDEADGKLVASSEQMAPVGTAVEADVALPSTPQMKAITEVVTVPAMPSGGSLSLHVELRIQVSCTPDEIPRVTQEIRALLSELRAGLPEETIDSDK